MNYYNWVATPVGSTQDYDIVVRYLIPEDFGTWDSSVAISFWSLVDSIPGATGVTATIYDTTNTQKYTSAATIQNTSWTATSLTAANIAGTYTIGSYMTIRFKVLSDKPKNVKLGEVKLKYNVR